MNLIGHQTAQTQIGHLLQSGRFPHALLVHGPRGIGKRALAQLLAYRLICGAPPMAMGPLEYDAESPQAAQLAAGSCPDYYVLEPEDGKKSTGIKQVRELLESLQRSADTARTVIIDSLEDLTAEAANTLLKTLEEPRPGIYFLMLSHQLSGVLPTIRSRARLLRLGALSLEETRKVLAQNNADTSLAPLAEGAPGNVLGAGGKARQKLLEQLGAGQLPATNAEGVLDALLGHMARQPATLQTAETYFQIQKLKARQQEINLPQALVNESALAKL